MKLILIIAMLGLMGCSSLSMNKDCKSVPDTNKYLCKTVLPWESI